MAKANYHKNKKIRNAFIIIVSAILLSAFAFCIDYMFFISSISYKMEDDFRSSFRQRDISYIEKYFDENTVFEYKKHTIKYKDAKKNIINALSDEDIVFRDGLHVDKIDRKIFFRGEPYYFYLLAYFINPYQGSETGLIIDVEVTGYKKFIITQVRTTDKFWEYAFFGEKE